MTRKQQPDAKFTSIMGNMMMNTRDLLTWGTDHGHVDEAKLRLTVMARVGEAKKLIANGVSKRQAAKMLGVSEVQIRRDVSAPKGRKNAPKGRTGKGPRGPVREDDLIQEDCEHCETPQELWQNSLAQAAGDAVAMRSYWSRSFNDAWESFEVTSDLVKLAKQASEEWTTLAGQLSRRLKNGKNPT